MSTKFFTFLFLFFSCVTLCTATQFNEDEIHEIENSFIKNCSISLNFTRPAPNFLFCENNESCFLAAYAHEGDDLPYSIAVKAQLSDVVAEIRELNINDRKFLISKFIPIQTINSIMSENIEAFLSHQKIYEALQSGYNTLNFKDLLFSNGAADSEIINLLRPLLDKAAIQRLYLFNYLTDQQDFNNTNCLFQITTEAKIKPIAIDLEKAFCYFPVSRGEKYKLLFKEALDIPLEYENHLIIQNIIQTSWDDICKKIRNKDSFLEISFLNRIKILSDLYTNDADNFSITKLYNEAKIQLY